MLDITRIMVGLACGATLIATAAIAAPRTYQLPPETAKFKKAPGVDVAEANCLACHSPDYVAIQPPKKGAAFWDAEVHKMIKVYGAPIDETDAKAIAAYLAATY